LKRFIITTIKSVTVIRYVNCKLNLKGRSEKVNAVEQLKVNVQAEYNKQK